MRDLLIALCLCAFVVAWWNIREQMSELKLRGQHLEALARKTNTEYRLLRTLCLLDIQQDSHRAAIGSMLSDWNHLRQKGAQSLWPEIDGQLYYVSVFHASIDDNSEGPNSTVAILFQGERAVDALVHKSDVKKKESHYMQSTIDADGAYIISFYDKSGTANPGQWKESTWRANADGYVPDPARSAERSFRDFLK